MENRATIYVLLHAKQRQITACFICSTRSYEKNRLFLWELKIGVLEPDAEYFRIERLVSAADSMRLPSVRAAKRLTLLFYYVNAPCFSGRFFRRVLFFFSFCFVLHNNNVVFEGGWGRKPRYTDAYARTLSYRQFYRARMFVSLFFFREHI